MWENRIIVVDVDNTDFEYTGAGSSRHTSVLRDHCQLERVLNLAVDLSVCLDDATEWWIDNEGTIGVSVNDLEGQLTILA